MDNDALLENISAFLYEKYDMEQVKRICLHGDGGTWMNSMKDVRVSRSKTERNHDKAALRGGFARYRQYAAKQMDMFLNKKLDWSIFEEPVRRSGKPDGMGMLLATFGREHGVLHST